MVVPNFNIHKISIITWKLLLIIILWIKSLMILLSLLSSIFLVLSHLINLIINQFLLQNNGNSPFVVLIQMIYINLLSISVYINMKLKLNIDLPLTRLPVHNPPDCFLSVSVLHATSLIFYAT